MKCLWIAVAGSVVMTALCTADADEASISNAVAKLRSTATNAPVNLKLRDFSARKQDLDGKLVKIQFSYKGDFTQIGQQFYQAYLSDGNGSVNVLLPKDGYLWLKGCGTPNWAYGVVMTEGPLSRRAYFGRPYYTEKGAPGIVGDGFYGADMLLIGRHVQCDFYGKPTYTW